MRSLSRSEVRDVDRRAIEEFGLPGIVLMENAGRNAAALFHAAAPFDAALVLSGPVKRLAPQAAVAVLVGIMPLLNGVSRWDSALSFNVYSGNQSSAVVVLQPDAVQSLPPAVAAHVTRGDTSAVLDLDAWSMAAFNAGVYPERRVFRRLFTRLCDWVGPDAACLVVVEKATWFTPKATTIHAGNAGP